MDERSRDRLERGARALAYAVLWDFMLVVLITYIQLMLTKKADTLLPFKALILMGFAFLALISIYSVYLHVAESGFQGPISLGFKMIVSIASVATAIYSIPPVFMIEAWLTLNIPYNLSILPAFVVGVFAALIGLASMTYHVRA